MKVLIFSGNHSRHLFINKVIVEMFPDCAAVVMERENLLPAVPQGIQEQDELNFRRHFMDRYKLESATFGSLSPINTFEGIPVHYCRSTTLNDIKTIEFVRKFSPDFVFIFGTDLIKGELLDILPDYKINLHLGLSPWYRGSATLFWPFYFLQPQYAGATFHQIVSEADAGDIVHQSIPELIVGDGIHDVAIRTLITARKDLIKILEKFSLTKQLNLFSQKSSGRLFLTKDFHYSHLRVIYGLYNNNIVDEYLSGRTIQTKPKILNAFQ